MLSMLGKISAGDILKYFSYFFFFRKLSLENLHELKRQFA